MPTPAPNTPFTSPRGKDIELWQKWKKSQSQMDLENLMNQMMPLIRREANRWKNIVPVIVLEASAKNLALGAFKSYDLNRGVLLSTHLVNCLQPLSRLAYARQSTLSIPEEQRITFNKIQRTHAQLEDELGHKPTVHHISDRLGLPAHEIEKIINNVSRTELLESGEGPAFEHSSDDDLIHLAFHDMTDLQKKIFIRRTGYAAANPPNPALILDGAEIMKELGISQGQLSYQLAQITKLLEKVEQMR